MLSSHRHSANEIPHINSSHTITRGMYDYHYNDERL
jgi:hypothetical protein